jgi:hypothetical protein
MTAGILPSAGQGCYQAQIQSRHLIDLDCTIAPAGQGPGHGAEFMMVVPFESFPRRPSPQSVTRRQ